MTGALEVVDKALHSLEIESNRKTSVYRIVSKNDGERCEREGIKIPQEIQNDLRGWIAEKAENIFIKVVSERLNTSDPAISRKKCIFAFPKDPAMTDFSLPFNPEEQAIMSFDIDPKKALICEGDCFTEACIALLRCENDEVSRLESVRHWAEEYWNTAEVFDDYLQRLAEEGSESDHLNFPEILVFESVPKEAIRRHNQGIIVV